MATSRNGGQGPIQRDQKLSRHVEVGDSPQEGAELRPRVWVGKKLTSLERLVGNRQPKGK